MNMSTNIFKKPIVLVVIVVLALSVYFFLANVRLPDFITGNNQPGKMPKPVAFLKAPEGFIVSVFAKNLNDPRVIAFDPAGRILVSETAEGKVLVLEDKNKDGMADETRVLLEGLNKPHGLAFYPIPSRQGGSYGASTDGGKTYLYIAETNQVARYIYDEQSGTVLEQNKIGQNIANLPADGKHFTRTIEFGPNYQTQPIVQGVAEETMSPVKLYISVGSSCDICVEDSWKRAAILESDPDGSYTAELAGGLRNSVFFTFHPETKEMWATEMGRDYLGDDLPPDEINIIKPNRKYGWPFCYGKQVKDKSFNPEKINRTDIPQDCNLTQPPVIEIPAHSAPLGLAFIPDKNWPKEWEGNLLVAYHGSWDRSVPTGYKIVRYAVDKNGKVSETADFITGWLGDGNPSTGSGQETFGRPVDLKFGPDGALYVSDDYSGQIYKVERVK